MKKMYRLIITMVMVWSGSQYLAQAQDVPMPTGDSKILPSVNGNSSIGNIHNPNLFDGSTNISIPVYSYQNDYGSYGLSFSYNTKGVKVEESSGAIGLHWNQSAGGSVQRVLKSLPDEFYCDDDFSGIFLLGKMAHGLSSINDPFPYIDSPYKDKVDEEHDDFIVSLPGLSFTFNIGKDGFLFTHPKSYVKVELILGGAVIDTIPLNCGDLAFGFKITDKRGVIYYLDPDAKSQYYHYTYASNTSEQKMYGEFGYYSNWRLSKIVFPNRTEIRYSYIPFKTRYGFMTFNQYQSVTNITPATGGFSAMESQAYSLPYLDTVAGNIPMLLDSIIYPNNVNLKLVYKDSFSSASEATYRCDGKPLKLLDEIIVNNGGYKLRYELVQSYRHSTLSGVKSKNQGCLGAEIDINNYRMYLDGIVIYNSDKSDSVLYYEFEYNALRLPAKNSGAKDVFGYYNGNTAAGTTSIPRHRNMMGGTDSFGVHRPYNADFAQAALLTKVKNSYGGIFELKYESHQLQNSTIPTPSGTTNFLGRNANDGVRLMFVTEYDIFFPENKLTTAYTYSGGIRFIDGGYFYTPKKYNNSGVVSEYLVSNNFTSSHQLINGSNHGYSLVDILTHNGTTYLGRKRIRFTNIVDSANGNAPRYTLVGGSGDYFKFPFADKQYLRDWEIGLPVETTEYDHGDNIVSRTRNYYNYTIDSLSTMHKISNHKYFLKFGSHQLFLLDSNVYRPYSGSALLQKTVTEKYLSNTLSIKDTTEFEYNAREELKKVVTKNSKGEQIFTNNLYHHEVHPPLSAFSALPEHMSLQIGFEKWKKSAESPDSDLLLDASFSTYTHIADSNIIRSDKVWKYNPGTLLSRLQYKNDGTTFGNQWTQLRKTYGEGAYSFNFMEPVSAVTYRDVAGNPTEVQLLDKDIFSVMLWDPVNGNKLSEITNARSAEVGFAGFDEAFPNTPIVMTGHQQKVGNFSAHLSAYQINPAMAICGRYFYLSPLFGYRVTFSNAMITGKQYILSFWSRGGIPAVTGAGISDFSFTSVYSKGAWVYYTARFTATDTTPVKLAGKEGMDIYIDEVRLHPSDVQMQTYTYTPVKGVTATADSRGRITYFEHDNFGRLTTVRDQEGRIIQYTDLDVRIED